MSKKTDFNFEEFTDGVLQAVDSVRSYGQHMSSAPLESRINALYRAIGLPAVIPKDNSSIDKSNNGNVFSVLDYNTYAGDFATRQNGFFLKPQEEEIKNFILHNTSEIADSIHGKRSRGNLFPMVVDGTIPIFPQERRVAGAFSKDDEIVNDDIKYKRPLIETIIHIRLRSDGLVDTDQQKKLVEQYTGKKGVFGVKEVGSASEQILKNAIDTIPKFLYDMTKRMQKNQKKIYASYLPSIANIPRQNPASVAKPSDEADRGEINKKQKDLEDRTAIKNAYLSLFDYDNETMLSSNLTQIFNETHEAQRNASSSVEKEKEENEMEKTKAETETKFAFKIMDQTLGTFSGLSGIDVLIVFSALYTLQLQYLVGFLNDEAYDRLKKLNPNANVPVRASVQDSISGLEISVRYFFDSLATKVANRKIRKKPTNAPPTT